MTNKHPDCNSLSYKEAGVNIEAGNELVQRIKPHVARTHRAEVYSGLGGFGAICDIDWKRYQQPLLVSATDGVGTKLKLAIDTGIHHTVGIDLVAMCVNDLIVQGAEPLFFLDYYASAKLNVEIAESVIKGICKGCELAGAALVGGETAEMPGMYQDNDYDLAGFCVGLVEKSQLITGENVKTGDTVIGLASSGLHSNGYSLIRKIIEQQANLLDQQFESSTFAEVLLEPTRIYVKTVLKLLQHYKINSIAHITGGGLPENLPRVIPESLTVKINLSSWQRPAIFDWLQKTGNIAEMEMLRTFNCGIGLVIIVSANQAEACLEFLQQAGEQAFVIGEVIPASSSAVVFN